LPDCLLLDFQLPGMNVWRCSPGYGRPPSLCQWSSSQQRKDWKRRNRRCRPVRRRGCASQPTARSW